MNTMSLRTKAATAVAGIATVAVVATACSSSATPIATVPSLSGNSTSVALTKGFYNALGSLHVKPGTIGSATLDAKTLTVTFPITGGNVKVYKKGDVTPYVQGSIEHNGSGLSLTAGSTVVKLTNFDIDPGNDSNLTGDVQVNNGKTMKGVRLFDLDGGTLKPITVNGAGVATLTGTTVYLSSDAAKLLDGLLKTQALKGGTSGGTEVGIATLKVATK